MTSVGGRTRFISTLRAKSLGLLVLLGASGIFAQAAIHLGEYRKVNPGPMEEFIFYDHPSGRNRIYAAMRWKAENLEPFTRQGARDPTGAHIEGRPRHRR
jgi:STE24 endopeptidase